ncbi:MAG: hypothetical protein H0U74_06175 [Bradymonadaceae bacterium]|nr:hypothetical protein [Lujinxingiaceae bacterium]
MRSLVALVLLLFGVALALPVSAQQAPAKGVLLLMTEEVEGQGGAKPAVNFWWSTPNAPSWTASDKVVIEALKSQGMEAVVVRDANISRIYRTANISLANAATLGGLLGAERVIVGQIRYRTLAAVEPLNLVGVEAYAAVHLVAAGAADADSLKRFTVERQSFGADATSALEDVRGQTAQALGLLMGKTLIKGAGPVGVTSKERLIGLRNVESAQVLDAIKKFLVEIEVVEAVRERWASEGIIALEINPGALDGEDRIEYVLRVLENHSFDGFRVVRNSGQRSANLAEFFIERVQAEGF